MKRLSTSRTARTVLGFALFAAASCGGSSSSAPIVITSVSVSAPSATVIVGRTLQLQAVAHDAEGFALTGVSFVWSSSALAVATVSQSGVVTAIAPGPVTISAKTGDIQGSKSLTVQSGQPA